MAKYANQNLVAFKAYNGLLPNSGPKSLAAVFDFTVNTSYDVELETVVEGGRLDFVQSVYIDNSANLTQSLTITFGESQQVIKIKPSTQGYYPVLCPSTKLTVALSAAGAANTMVIFLSMPMPAVQWATA